MKMKKRYTSEEKTMILRELLENQVSVSELAEKYKLHPNAIYKWKKQMFEATPGSLSKINKNVEKLQQSAEKEIAELKALLSKREALIAELVEDNINLKKNINGVNLMRNGLSRR
jgi:transposase-like protein